VDIIRLGQASKVLNMTMDRTRMDMTRSAIAFVWRFCPSFPFLLNSWTLVLALLLLVHLICMELSTALLVEVRVKFVAVPLSTELQAGVGMGSARTLANTITTRTRLSPLGPAVNS